MTEPTIRARMVPNLVDVVDEFFEGTEGTRTDPGFLALADRIAGKVVDLTFTCGDAFEAVDGNYWLPECAWERVL